MVDYRAQRFEDVVREVDISLDTLGGEVQQRSWAVLKPGGILVSTAAPPSEEHASQYDARGTLAFIHPNAEQLTELAKMVELGSLRPVVETAMPLSEAWCAQRVSQGGHTRGKIVLLVSRGFPPRRTVFDVLPTA